MSISLQDAKYSLTLADLLAHDPTPSGADPERRFICPFPDCAHHTNGRRDLTVNVDTGAYHCWSCGTAGKMVGTGPGRPGPRRPPVRWPGPKIPKPPKAPKPKLLAQRLVCTYEIRDFDGTLIARRPRKEGPDHGTLDADGHKINNKSVGWHWVRGQRRPTTDLLYGAERLAGLPDGTRVISVEGEKACDALTARGILAVGFVCGAESTPSARVLDELRRFDAVLWPDADASGKGQALMRRVATRLLEGRGRVPRWFTIPDAADHDDAANYLGLTEELAALLDQAPSAHTVLIEQLQAEHASERDALPYPPIAGGSGPYHAHLETLCAEQAVQITELGQALDVQRQHAAASDAALAEYHAAQVERDVGRQATMLYALAQRYRPAPAPGLPTGYAPVYIGKPDEPGSLAAAVGLCDKQAGEVLRRLSESTLVVTAHYKVPDAADKHAHLAYRLPVLDAGGTLADLLAALPAAATRAREAAGRRRIGRPVYCPDHPDAAVIEDVFDVRVVIQKRRYTKTCADCSAILATEDVIISRRAEYTGAHRHPSSEIISEHPSAVQPDPARPAVVEIISRPRPEPTATEIISEHCRNCTTSLRAGERDACALCEARERQPDPPSPAVTWLPSANSEIISEHTGDETSALLTEKFSPRTTEIVRPSVNSEIISEPESDDARIVRLLLAWGERHDAERQTAAPVPNLEIISELPPTSPARRCFACGSARWWMRPDGSETVCAVCHPPLGGAL